MIIDIHNHFLPERFPDLPLGVEAGAWPQMVDAEGDRRTMMIGDKPFRTFDDLYWNIDRRVASMDAQHVDVQVVSPLPELLSYWVDAEAGAAICRAVNDAGSAMAGQAPERLRYLAILPLQDVDRSLAELSRIAGDSALAGLFVGSHVNGMSIANARFDPIVAEAERLGLFIFVHGIRPAGGERLEGGPLLNAAIGIPHENSCAVASFMMRDVLGRHPALKLVFSHGGGGIGAVIDRLSLIWSEFAQMRTALAMPPIDYARRFQYDTAVFGVDYVRYLVARFGAQAIVAGTDGPTEIGQKDLAGFLARAGLEGHELEAVAGGNAAALIGMKKTGRREPAIA